MQMHISQGAQHSNALGLHTKKLQDQHFSQFVHKIPPPQFPSDIQQRMEYGSENEVKCIGNFVRNFHASTSSTLLNSI